MYKRSRALRIDTVLVLISLSGISSMSLRWCPGWLKCSGTAWSVLFSMALRCSPNLSFDINWRKLKVDKGSNHFPLGDHFVNLEIFYLDLCVDIDRRKVRLITLELASHVLTAPRLSVQNLWSAVRGRVTCKSQRWRICLVAFSWLVVKWNRNKTINKIPFRVFWILKYGVGSEHETWSPKELVVTDWQINRVLCPRRLLISFEGFSPYLGKTLSYICFLMKHFVNRVQFFCWKSLCAERWHCRDALVRSHGQNSWNSKWSKFSYPFNL